MKCLFDRLAANQNTSTPHKNNLKQQCQKHSNIKLTKSTFVWPENMASTSLPCDAEQLSTTSLCICTRCKSPDRLKWRTKLEGSNKTNVAKWQRQTDMTWQKCQQQNNKALLWLKRNECCSHKPANTKAQWEALPCLTSQWQKSVVVGHLRHHRTARRPMPSRQNTVAEDHSSLTTPTATFMAQLPVNRLTTVNS